MEKTTLLAEKLKSSVQGDARLKRLTFTQGETFSWSHTACVITYNPHAPNAASYLLHEYGHALLGHQDYVLDIDLLHMERSAWDKAIEVAALYQLAIDEVVVEDAMDSYRDWLHYRSLCPACGATGIQTTPRHYYCLACEHKWAVNDARTCQLRRYSTKKRP